MKTPYATTPMRSTCRRTWIDLDDEEVGELEGGEEGDIMILQCLEDSIGRQRGEIGMWATDARYITLHGGVEALNWARFTFASFIRRYRRAAAEIIVQFVGIQGSACLNSNVDLKMVST